MALGAAAGAAAMFPGFGFPGFPPGFPPGFLPGLPPGCLPGFGFGFGPGFGRFGLLDLDLDLCLLGLIPLG